MFEIKICGVTTADNGLAVAAAGADAIGLNFYEQSKRHVSVPKAVEISTALPKAIQRVGVFVNSPLEEIQRIAEDVRLDWVQLHGDEPSEWIAQLPEGRVIRAIRWRDETVGQLCDQWGASGAAALLVDAYSPDAYGGTGHRVDWSVARELAGALPIPMMLAGGLTETNVGEAIRTARPAAVDTASGVESSPGVKDAERVRRFVAASRLAFNDNAGSKH